MLPSRILAFFISVAVFSAVYQIGSMSELNEDDAKLFIEQFNELTEGIDPLGIFFHNTAIAMTMFIPGFGVAWGLFSAGVTGYAFAAITSTAPELSELPPLALLYLTPFGIMELTAYSLGISRSAILIWMIIKKQDLRTAIKPLCMEIAIVLGLLLGGAYIEHYMIEALKGGSIALAPA